MQTTLIVGGTGKTGRRIATRLAARGVRHRITSRQGDPPFDWHDERTWPGVLRDVTAAYLAYAPDIAVPGAAEHLARFSRLAVNHGVARLVLLAGRGEPEVAPAEQAIRESGAAFTILESAFFCQNFSEGFLAPHDGEIVFPAGATLEPFVDADDIADVAVEALTTPDHAGRTYDLTGPRTLSFADATAELATATGRPLRYVQVSFEAYREMLAPFMLPHEAAFISEMIRGLLDGRNAHVGDGVSRALGRSPRDFRAFARTAMPA